MNVKFFFMKDLNDYVPNPEELLGDDEFLNHNEDLKKAVAYALYSDDKVAREIIYSKLIRWHIKNIDKKSYKEIFEDELYGDTGIENLKIDFNFGLRLDIPEGDWHVKISDFDSGQIFFDEDISDTRLLSSENYFVNWCVEIFQGGEKIFEHVLDLENQNVLIAVQNSVMGDLLTMLPYIQKFQKLHRCKIFVYIPKYLRELVKNFCPDLEQVEKISGDYYASYYPLVSMGMMVRLPVDTRILPLEQVGAINLGLQNYLPEKLKFTPTADRKIAKPYVCISVQASINPKSWLYPEGWEIVCDYLKNLGYRVLCIDKNKIQKGFGYTVQKPEGAEDFTGDLPLIERANLIYYADFFIGLGSGLSWLAYYVGCEVILISGFSQDFCEFKTPYRVANRFVCNGCYNDIESKLFSTSICPRYKGTNRELECQKKISPRQVISAIENLIDDKKILETKKNFSAAK